MSVRAGVAMLRCGAFKIILLFIALFQAENIRAQNLHLAPVSSLYDGGRADICLSGDTAYCACATGVELVNFDDQDHPLRIGQILRHGGAQKIALLPTGLALAGDDSLLFYIHSSSGDPVRCAGLQLASRIVFLEYYHDFLYFVDEHGWGRIDCGQINNPVVDYYSASPVRIKALTFAADSLLLGRADGMNLVFHLRGTPQAVNAFRWRPNITSLAVSWPLIAATCGDSGVFIADYSRESGDQEIGRFYTYGNATESMITPAGLCVADSARGLLMLSIENPQIPYLLGFNREPHGLQAVARQDRYLAGTAANGVFIFDLNNPLTPETTAHYGAEYAVRDLALTGELLVAAVEGAGLCLINVDDATLPIVLSEILLADTVFGLAADGQLAALAAGEDGLILVDISDPTMPTEVFREVTIGSARDVALEDGLAVVADYIEGFRIFDVSDPAGARLIGGKSINRPVTNVARRDNVVYLSGLNTGFRAFDISFAFKPEEVYHYDIDGKGEDIFLSANLAFWSVDNEGVYVFDISRPASPRLIDHWEMARHPRRVAGEGALYYVFDDSLGVLLIDYRFPGEPRVISQETLAAPGVTAAVGQELVCFAGKQYLFISRVEPPVLLGDMDEDGRMMLLDAVLLVNYLFRHGPPPLRTAAMDFDSDGSINMVDLVRFIRILFHSPD